MSKLSLIINTASMDPFVAAKGNMYRQGSYGDRRSIVRELISSSGFDEVIVAGNFEPGEGYTYLELEPQLRDRRDALWQREMGARHATGDVLVFTHDDHVLDEGFAEKLRLYYIDGFMCDISDKAPDPECKCGTYHSPPEWDLIVPKRIHGLTGEELNNGKEEGYMGGHSLVMRRWLWAEVPWMSVNTEWWDTTMTRLWREAGGTIVWSDKLVHIDREAKETER